MWNSMRIKHVHLTLSIDNQQNHKLKTIARCGLCISLLQGKRTLHTGHGSMLMSITNRKKEPACMHLTVWTLWLLAHWPYLVQACTALVWHGLPCLLLILAYHLITCLFSTNSATMLMPSDIIYSWHHHALSNKNILKSWLLSTVQISWFVYHLVSLAKFTHTTEANILLG